MRKCLATWGVLILVLAGVAFAQAPGVITSVTQEVTSGMFTLVPGNTAKVNVLNIGGVTFQAGATCTVTVSFFDGSGSATPKYTQTIANLGSGAAASVTFPPPTLSPVAVTGIYRAAISYPLTPTPAAGSTAIPVRTSCSLIPTLELFDSSGRTNVLNTQFYGVPQILPLSPLLSRP